MRTRLIALLGTAITAICLGAGMYAQMYAQTTHTTAVSNGPSMSSLRVGGTTAIAVRGLLGAAHARAQGNGAQKSVATVQTDKFDYQPGETAIITGSGFAPGEWVTLHVVHANGFSDGVGLDPFYTLADPDGNIADQWYVHPDHSLNALFMLTAVGQTSARQASAIFTDAFFEVKDDGGVDDINSNQVDINSMGTDEVFLPETLGLKFQWDDTGWSGGNTGDACALFDSDSPTDGLSNFAMCVKVDSNPAVYRATSLYTCNNTRTDRCAGPTLLWTRAAGTPTPVGSSYCSATSSGVATDPFIHGKGNVCSGQNCTTRDTVAACTIVMDEVGAASAFLINVCTVPSNSPNSNPFDCVITPDNGFLTIVKEAEPKDSTVFTFALGANEASQNGQTNWTIKGSDTPAERALISFRPGSYSLNEVVPSTWKLDSAECVVSGAPTGAASGDRPAIGPIQAGVSGFEIRPGQETRCTFRNSKNTGTLKLVKTVVNDNGGVAVAADFSLWANGTRRFYSGVAQEIDPGVYELSETGPTGYEAGAWSCSPFTNGGSLNGSTVSMRAGEQVTCEIVNNDRAATLTVIKQVINDNGGTKTAADFTMTVNGGYVSQPSFPGSTEGTTVTLDAGSYSVNEINVDGYAKTIGTGCSGTIANGETKTCTITNDDQAATLTVIKHVVNTSGGTKTAPQFTINVTGTNPSPASFPGSESGTTVTLDAGGYSVDEADAHGYTKALSSDCTGTIKNGETKTCTITNTDQAATLKVIKHVINDNGGTKVAADFVMKVTGTQVSASAFPGSELGTTVTLAAGSYSVNEELVAGYAQSLSGDCTGTIANGETRICTVTNDDLAATLKVIKHVINDHGGTKTAAAFTLNVTGTNVSSSSFPGAEAPGTTVTLNAGDYSVDEGPVTGYVKTIGAGCSGAIANGETRTCTITNDDQAATLIVIKHVINDHGGTQSAAAFTINVGGTNVSSPSFAGAPAPGTTVTLNAGDYMVTEGDAPGYTKSFSADCVGTIASGETKTCTVTNDDQAATLIVIKHVINDNGGTQSAAAFTLNVTGTDVSLPSFPGSETGTTVSLDAGGFSVDEEPVAGYVKMLGPGCSGAIANGETKTCTITNNDELSAPTMATVQRALLFDTAVLSGLRPGAANAGSAKVTFSLFTTPTCSAGTQVGSSEDAPIALVGGVPTATMVKGIWVSGSGQQTFYWKTEYSGDQFNAAASECGVERVLVNFTDSASGQ